jgi:hypothetical protein
VLDSCGNSGKVETPQGKARGGSTHAPPESEHLERKSTTTRFFKSNKVYKKSLLNK